MASKTLGLDLGTNSIGWAIVNHDDSGTALEDAGVLIFQEGVARPEGKEKPAVEKRTKSKGARRHYFRRRLRKIELLKVLVSHNMCPVVSDDELENWRNEKLYPKNEEFLLWQRTNGDDNPYFARYEALNTILDLSNIQHRYLLGRAFYHLVQRRGFLSNRKDQSKKTEGVVKGKINGLTSLMKDYDCDYLGELFYILYRDNKKIRNNSTDRLQHIEKEFYAICNKQNLSPELVKELHRAIFYQRPLKSQKGLVGKCIFETNKARCPLSHPAFEEYRMLSFINNIKVKTHDDSDFRPLTNDERNQIKPLFFRKSKDSFDFEDIAKKIAGKGNYSFRDDKIETAYKFNFRMTASVSGCPTTAGLIGIFGDDWIDTVCSTYLHANNKTERDIINDVWHVLYSFDSDEKLVKWAMLNLQLDEKEAKSFTEIKIQQGYASLSLKAINKILPFLRAGMRYDEAVFVANLDYVLPDNIKNDDKRRNEIIYEIACIVANYHENPLKKTYTKEQLVKGYLEDIPDIDFNKLQRLYHPSKLNIYPDATVNSEGKLLLGSPRTSSVRNPMAMRALFKLRHLINQLLIEGKINRDTRINIEFARGLNDANKRKAIERFQREREKQHKDYYDKIKTLYKDTTGCDIEPTETDILKYQLWEEQKKICLYTGEQIGIADFLGDNPKYDIEHTIPRSLGGDDSQMNKTLCNSVYNRSVKKNILPAKLPDAEKIMSRIESLNWQQEIAKLRKKIDGIRTSGAATKDAKDDMIQNRHYLKMKLDYLHGKLERFTMQEVPEGFTNRQGVDIGIIGKYAKEYLKTLFKSEERQIFIVKGATTAEFRTMWGLQPEYTKKERINHTHHAIDAITIACIGRGAYQRWAEYTRNYDTFKFFGGEKPIFAKPWTTFTEDVKKYVQNILVVHNTPDNTLKQSRKVLKKRGKQLRGADGKLLYQQGDTARAMLHEETYYGAINRNGDIKYVLRVPLNLLSEKDIYKNIVDGAVREKVKQALELRGFKHLLESKIWMNEEKGIEIKKVRIEKSVKKPLDTKKHRDLSKHPHKQSYHVKNELNYCMAIYEGMTNKGKMKRSFRIVNNLDAVKLKKSGNDLVPLSDNDDQPLKWLLKVGTMVLFYENSPAELIDCSQEQLTKRLYKVSGFSIHSGENGKGLARINLLYHQEARKSKDISYKNGIWKQGEELRPGIIVLHTQFNALVQGRDFTISETGEISFTHNLC